MPGKTEPPKAAAAEGQPMDLDPTIRARIEEWLGPGYDKATHEELQALIAAGNSEELVDRFSTHLEFGTGGLRGIMGAGTNRMNAYVVAKATQGLANHLVQAHKPGDRISVVVSYDSRRHSLDYARETASVLAGNGIRAFLFETLHPIPLLSFAIRHLGSAAGVMITASHNPKQYNGYKVYWDDGAQIVPPHDSRIIAEVQRIESLKAVKKLDFEDAMEKGLISIVGDTIDQAYLAAICPLSMNPALVKQYANELSIVYTPLHGTGITITPRALKAWGFQNVNICDEQAEPDGDFPTTKSPNPEDPAAMELATRLASKIRAELVLATDPDADRLGTAVRTETGEYVLLTGNQVAALLTYYLLDQLHQNGRLPRNAAVVKTIVTTELISAICAAYRTQVVNVLTGFKWIGEKIRLWEDAAEGKNDRKAFILGAEESYGYLIGTHARDKDAVVCACMVAEMASWAKSRGRTLVQMLDDLMCRFGVFHETQKSMGASGQAGLQHINTIMETLRNNPPAQIGALPVIRISDVKKGCVVDRQSGRILGHLALPESDVLCFHFPGESQVVARPSGTEPKIKFYFMMSDIEALPIASNSELQKRKAALQELTQDTMSAFCDLVDSIAD
jgi:phosphoglucomutase